MYHFLTEDWVHLMAEKLLWDRGRTRLFSSGNLHKKVCSCILWKENRYTISLLQCRFWHLHQEQGSWGLDLQDGIIHTEDPTSPLLIKFTLCGRLSPAWSPAQISWLLSSHISKHVWFSPFISKESISCALQYEECSDWKQVGRLLLR